MAERLDTFPRLLLHHAQVRGDHPAIREKDLGIWQAWTWARGRRPRSARSPAASPPRGFKRGMSLAIVGENRPRLYWAVAAVQCLGGIPDPALLRRRRAGDGVRVPERRDRVRARRGPGAGRQAARGPDAVPEARAHLLRRRARPAELRAARARELREPPGGRPRVRRAQPRLLPRRGREGPAVTTPRRCSSPPAPPAIRRAWCLTHANLITAARMGAEMEGLTPDEEMLAYLPPAWIGQNIFSYAQPYVVGFCVSCPESVETVMADMREIGPTYYFAVPRVLEALLTQVTIRMEDASALKRGMYQLLHGGRAARRRRRSSTRRSRCASSTGCCTGSATSSSTGRCGTCSA